MKPQDLDTILNESNATYIAQIYARYLENPSAVDQSWAEFFDGLQDDASELLAEMRGPSWQPRETKVVGGMEGYDVSQGHAERQAQVAYAPAALAAPGAAQVNSDAIRAAANAASVRGRIRRRRGGVRRAARGAHRALRRAVAARASPPVP